MDNLDPRIDALIDAYIDSSVDDEQFETLCAWLREDAEHRHAFARKLALHSEIAEWCIERSGSALAGSLNTVEAEDELPTIQYTSSDNKKQGRHDSLLSYAIKHSFKSNRVAMLATAAALLIGMVLAIVLLGGPEPEQQPQIVEGPPVLSPEPTPAPPVQPEQITPDPTPPQPEVVPPQPEPIPEPAPQPEPQPQPDVVPVRPILATVNELIGAEWAGADWQAQDELKSGKFKLINGSVLLEMASGAKTLIMAPATFTLTGTNELILDTGALDAQVPPQAMGFTVTTPDARIVDIGTEFSVAIDEEAANTTVSVHVGEVRASAKAGDPNANPPKALLAGDAVSVGKEATLQKVDYVAGGFEQAVKVARTQPEFTGGAVSFSKTPPADLSAGSSTAWKLQLFQEQEGAELSRNVTVNMIPGDVWPIRDNARRQIKAGTKVDVYLIHVNADTAYTTKTHTIRFDRPILGIATSPTALRATDVLARKGHRRAYDSNMDHRGIEPNDILQLSDDGMTLTVQLKTEKQNVDNARLFVLSQETDE